MFGKLIKKVTDAPKKAMGTIIPCAKNNISKVTITLISVTSRALTRK